MRGKTVCFSAVLSIFVPLRAAQAQDVDVPDNLTMTDSTATQGNVLKAGVLFLHNFGTSNTFLGSNAGNLTMSGRQNTASGYNALMSNTTGELNTASGVGALRDNTTGSSNTASGYRALFSNTTGTFNTAIGYGADVTFGGNLTNATAIGANALVDDDNKIRLGNHDVTVIEGEVGFTASSDRNKKENFQPVGGEEVLGKIRGLSLTSWNFIGQDPKRFRHYGPMAQDFFAAFGRDAIGTIGTKTTITSTDIDGILMIAAQALEERTIEQKKEIEALRGENADLKARLAALERRVGSSALAKAE